MLKSKALLAVFFIISICLFGGGKKLEGRVVIEGKWGDKPGEFGFSGEELPGGPSSFTIDKKGKFYINDCINNRIQIFSEEGKLLRVITLEKILPKHIRAVYGDIAVSGDRIFLSAGNKIYVLDTLGDKIDSYNVYQVGKLIADEDKNLFVHTSMGGNWLKFKNSKKIDEIKAADLCIVNGKKIMKRLTPKKEDENNVFISIDNGKEFKLKKVNERGKEEVVSLDEIPRYFVLIGGDKLRYFYISSWDVIWRVRQDGRVIDKYTINWPVISGDVEIHGEFWENVIRSKIAINDKLYHFGSTNDKFFILKFPLPNGTDNNGKSINEEGKNGKSDNSSSSSFLERFKEFFLTRFIR